jgi:hypothetical protein
MPRLLVLLAGFASLAVPAAASAQPLPQTATGRGDALIRPARIIASGDGSFVLGGKRRGSGVASFGRLHWTVYNTRAARATGLAWHDDCLPDCAEGTYHATAVRIRLFRSRDGVFTRMALTGGGLRHHTFRTFTEPDTGDVYWTF